MAPRSPTPITPPPAARLRRPWDVIDDDILSELTIELVFGDLKKLRPDGRNMKACCPIHGGDQSDAFFINPVRLEWLCFLGCGGGGPVQFLQASKQATWLEAAQSLAVLAGVDPSKLQLYGQHWADTDYERHNQLERRAVLLHVFMALARNSLLSSAGKSLRSFLENRHGLSEDQLADLGMGLYTTPSEVYPFLKNTGQDLGEFRAKGFFEADWTGSILLPWRDLKGRIVNLWRWNPTSDLLGQGPKGAGRVLFERDQIGSQQTPFLLHSALERNVCDLILMEEPLEAVLCAALGMREPHPISCAGRLVEEQIDILDRALAEAGSLTLFSRRSDSAPTGGEDALDRQLKALRHVTFPVFLVESDLLKIEEGSEPARPSQYIRARGLEALSRTVRQSEVALPANRQSSRDDGGWSSLGKVFRGFGRRDSESLFDDEGEPGPSASAGHSAFVGVLMQAAEEFGQRIAQGFLRALPRGLVGPADPALPPGPGSAALPPATPAPLLPEKTAPEPPPRFSVDRLEELNLSTASAKTSGWMELDNLGVRFRPGELAFLGGRSGHGRTSALVGMLVCWLQQSSEDLVFISYDESEVQIYHRLLSLLTAMAGPGLSVNFIRNQLGNAGSDQPSLSPAQNRSVEAARACLRSWESRLHLVYRPGWSTRDVEEYLRSLSGGEPLGAVLIDPADKISAPGAKIKATDPRWLKSLAVELACPVVASVRNSKGKPSKRRQEPAPGQELPRPDAGLDDPGILSRIRQERPRLGDFSEAFEREADLILGMLSHATVYASLGVGTPPEVAPLEIGVLKNRSGPTGDWVSLVYDRPHCLIRDTVL